MCVDIRRNDLGRERHPRYRLCENKPFLDRTQLFLSKDYLAMRCAVLAKRSGESIDQVGAQGARGTELSVGNIPGQSMQVHGQNGRIVGRKSLADQRDDHPGEHIAAPSDGKTRVASGVAIMALPVGHKGLMSFQNNDALSSLGQLDGRAVLFNGLIGWDVRQACPFARVRGKDPRAAGSRSRAPPEGALGDRIEGIGIEDSGSWPAFE